MLGDIHEVTGWVTIGFTGLVGLWGVAAAVRKREVGAWFALGTIVGLVMAVVQTGLGLVLYWQGLNPGSFHLFYGIVVLFAVAFGYIYKAQLAANPALRWGLLMLFVCGLGLRAWMTFGASL